MPWYRDCLWSIPNTLVCGSPYGISFQYVVAHCSLQNVSVHGNWRTKYSKQRPSFPWRPYTNPLQHVCLRHFLLSSGTNDEKPQWTICCQGCSDLLPMYGAGPWVGQLGGFFAKAKRSADSDDALFGDKFHLRNCLACFCEAFSEALLRRRRQVFFRCCKEIRNVFNCFSILYIHGSRKVLQEKD